jgi:hypothetical protein
LVSPHQVIVGVGLTGPRFRNQLAVVQ